MSQPLLSGLAMNREIVRPALGQTATVGTFYDARTDSFLAYSLVKENFPRAIVSRQDVPTDAIETGYQDGFNDKFKKLKIECDLGASILSGFVPLDGPGRYISGKTGDLPQLQSAIYHTITTVQERLEFHSPDLRSNIALSSLDTSDATHVLVEVTYGAQTIIVANQWLRPDEQQEDIEPRFKASIDDFVQSLRNKHPPAADKKPDSFEQVAVYGTISGNAELLLTGLQEARTYLDLLPAQIRTMGTGEGTPIMYRLTPVKNLELFGLIKVVGSEVTTAASSECLRKIFDVFDEFGSCRKTLQKHESFVSKYKQYVDPTSLQNVSRRLNDVNYAESGLRTELGQMLKDIRRGMHDPGDLWQLLKKFTEGELAPKTLASVDLANQGKLAFIDKVIGNGATYFGYNSPDLTKVLKQNRQQTAYVLFFNETVMRDQASWNANQEIFMKLLQEPHSKDFTAVVDCDATGLPLQKAAVTYYENGDPIVESLLEEQQYLSQYCFARYPPSSLETEDIERPLDRRFVKIACPGNNCAKDDVCDWRCSKCDAPLEYGFSDQYIYCDCGRALYSGWEFKCNHDRHGKNYAQYAKPELLACLKSLDQSNSLNILILGETGVGKSTFINAFINYLYFGSLDEALAAQELEWIIPCSFSTQTMDRSNPGSPIIENRIKVGTSDDEHDGSTGKSATQKTQVYPITVGSEMYRLIDTPGIGDTRGLEFDKQNMIDILATVSNYDFLHGIIILLKSNNARLTIHFAFCVKELLTHLHRDATNNVVFGFTNTRISNYMPGDTYGSLKALLTERPDIGLSLASNSAYCFDSESFRYLAAFKNGVVMDNKKDFVSSWERSSEEAHRMLEYFAKKEPHSVKSTTSLNGTRNLIKELTKPMAEISNLIRTNIDLVKDEIKDLQDARLVGDQLRTKLHPEKTLLRSVPLDKPKTVCSDASCIEHKDDGTGNMLVDYPNPCHPVCYLTSVAPDVVADPGLLQCWAFQGNEDCQQCGHKWIMHLHFIYELESYQTTIIDLGIEQQLKSHASDIELKRAAIQNREVMVEEYKAEHEEIQRAAAKFGIFMKEKSILPYNDATVAYLDMLIEAEQGKVDAGGGDRNKNTLKALQEDKGKHLELVDVLEKSMQGRGAAKPIDQDEVNRIVKQLYNLKHFGKTLEDLQTNIAYTHAATNRENPHRVKTRHAPRRGVLSALSFSHSSNNPIRTVVSGGSQGRSQNVIVKRNSLVRPGFSTGTMRPNQSSPVSSMPGGFNSPASQVVIRPYSKPKSNWGISSIFGSK